MIITSVIPRKDGKYLVGLHYNHGTNLRKVMTAEQLKVMRDKEAKQDPCGVEGGDNPAPRFGYYPRN